MITIGDRKLVFSETFLLRDNEEALIEVPLNNIVNLATAAKFKLVFKPDGEPKNTVNWRGDQDFLYIECLGMSNELSSTMARPGLAFSVNGEPFGFWIGHLLSGVGIHNITFQLYQGGTYGQ
jgi:hypothetical protein